jgi:hypothetical protein
LLIFYYLLYYKYHFLYEKKQYYLNMIVNSIIIDDFYQNPHEVRDFALDQDFQVRGNYPGMRTVSFLSDDIKQTLSEIIEPLAGRITSWGGEYTGSFQYTTSYDRSWIHSDSYTDWAGVCYLTPDAPLSSGTGLFQHKETGLRSWSHFEGEKEDERYNLIGRDSQDYTKWEIVDRVGNVFNRLILYRAQNLHVSLDYFGTTKENGRLFQVFFFNTEN